VSGAENIVERTKNDRVYERSGEQDSIMK
jgi:hypothetical protein